MTKTYWKHHPRKFANEFTVAVATSPEHAAQYEAEGFRRINREYALREMSYRPESHERSYISAELDGEQVYDRYMFARDIRAGQPPAR